MTDRLSGATVAVLGFGNQGEAQALNLRDSGVSVIVGAREGGHGWAIAKQKGFQTLTLEGAAGRASICAVMLPDDVVPSAWPGIAAALQPGAGVVFAHGFALLYNDLVIPAGTDVVLVSPTGPGRVLRDLYARGEGLPAYLAVHRDASGDAWSLAEHYGVRIGCPRDRLLRTTVREETEVDLFGEQAVLCGGMNALLTAAFETLVEHGYSPEIAYLECVHQLKYMADMVHRFGIAMTSMRISRTAQFGAITRGPRVVGGPSRTAMAELLEEIRSGAFAREFAEEIALGEPRLVAGFGAAMQHPIEQAAHSALARRGPRAG